MSQPRKIKRRKNPFGRSPKPWRNILIIVGIVALVFIGISVYKPVYNYITGKMQAEPDISSQAEEPSAVEKPPVVSSKPEEEIPEPVVKNENIHGAILTYDTASDPAKLDAFIAGLPDDINTLVIELKNSQGQIYYNTKNENATAWGATVASPINIEELSSKLKDKNLSLAAIMSIFSDPIAARGDLSNAVMHSSGVIWIDNALNLGGKPWTTPYSENARKYNVALAKELSEAGVSSIILDNLRFPNDPTNSAVFGETTGVSKHDILKQFVAEIKTAIGSADVSMLLDSESVIELDSQINQSRFGGNPLELSENIVLVEPDISLGMSYNATAQTVMDSKNVISMQTKAINNVPANKENYIISLSN